ncbi:hemolysin family protein [Desulfuromonas thiophila]|jgi:magnesium and cobalt transporter|uniref:hemolysin family protein n=1 Tax=Desulfuromonas thiophila TaxID=57664 RepID=UPI0024A89FB9|nr:hemolysin family protein [Desulfuromonas thiophila]MCK9172587.1 hemolysin family protein [Desulfuromonas thiophila]
MDGSDPDAKRPFWQRLFGWRRQPVFSEEELHELIQASEQQGVINAEEGEMFSSIIEFGETIVREEMIPRTEMHCCPVDARLSEMIEIIIRYGHSRIPVYEQTLDHIIGLVYAKDLLKYWGASDEAVSLRQIMRPPYFVPETKRIEELLHEFRSQRVHLAIAVDEYGGTSGLITLEDLIEEIIGDIKDEYDIEEDLLIDEGDGVVNVDARLNLYELEDHFDLPEIPRNQFDSVGGLLLHQLGRVPKTGEKLAYEQLCFEVLDSDARAIHRVRVWRCGAVAAEETYGAS